MESIITLRVEHTASITPRVRKLLLSSADATPLPAFTPGAHIELYVTPDGQSTVLRRAYSLVRPVAQDNCYEIAVQLEPAGSGGSKWVHELRAGQTLRASLPRNEFALQGATQRPLLLAAGIGITPLLSMALHLKAQSLDFEMHVVARDAEQAAYADEVQAFPQARCWFDHGDPTQGIPLVKVIGPPVAGRHLHVCGPKGFISAVLDTAGQLGWSSDALHSELFTGVLTQSADRAFEVELASSGVTLDVAVGQSVMQAMEAAGLDPIFDCRRGDCGICVAQVLQGQADHRDICLSAGERESGSFCICVSRAHSDLLVLDL